VALAAIKGDRTLAQLGSSSQTGRAGDVSDDVVELKIHLRHGLLHMLDVRGRVLQQTLALTHVGSQRHNLSFGSKAGPQQSKRMKPLQQAHR
jgi:hypothetical protein